MAFSDLADITIDIERQSYADGKYGGYAAHLSSVAATPIDPLDPETKLAQGIDVPEQAFVTFIDGTTDIRSEDKVIYGGNEYKVHSVAPWTWQSAPFYEVVLKLEKKR